MHNVCIIATVDKFEAMLAALKPHPVVCIDTETAGKESLRFWDQQSIIRNDLLREEQLLETRTLEYKSKYRRGDSGHRQAWIVPVEHEIRRLKGEIANLDRKAKESPSGLQFYNCHVGCVQLATESDVFLIRASEITVASCWGRLCNWLNSRTMIIAHNFQFDYKMLKYNLGMTLDCKNLWDTFIVEKLITNGKDLKCGLKDVLARRLGIEAKKISPVVNWLGDWTEQMAIYAVEDVAHLIAVKEQQKQQLIESGQWEVYLQERKLLPINANMEMQGLRADIDYLNGLVPLVKRQVDQLEAECKAKLGVDNPTSSSQVLSALVKAGLKLKDTNKKSLTKYEAHPLVALLLEYRKYAKLASTYLGSIVAAAVKQPD